MTFLRLYRHGNGSFSWGASALGGCGDLFAQRLPLGEATGVETPLALASSFRERPDCLTRNALANRNSPQ
ncbi:hypothetical protein [Nostoc sp.]|uniref:hypothetical protein n=1 Tax=Nostoc sp. TaxID=1180 RepID=UPI002FF93880